MNIRWRISVLVVELIVLLGTSWIITHKPITGETWFLAGLFAVVINPTLLEPFYPRPVDVIGNSLISIYLGITTNKQVTLAAWEVLISLLGLAIVFSLIAITLGSKKDKKPFSSLAKPSSIISREFTALRIYSAVFFLSAIEKYPHLEPQFWMLVLAWLIVYILVSVNWQKVWNSARGITEDSTAEGMIGPSTLLISAPNIPEPGKGISLSSGKLTSSGIVLSRIRRPTDVWGQVHMQSQKDCEELLRMKDINIQSKDDVDLNIIGSVDIGSDETHLLFSPTQSLEIGNAISVINSSNEILYQISSAKIYKSDVKGGSSLQVQSQASQLGIFDPKSLRLQPFRWVASPGASVVKFNTKLEIDPKTIPPTWVQLGTILGTVVPIFIDIQAVCEGHIAILGMTKMGKTSLAVRLANRLGIDKAVTILDQTGEYISKRKMVPFNEAHLKAKNGIKVFEPKPGDLPPVSSLSLLNRVITVAKEEYQSGIPLQRVLLIDEAHQFIPEPSGMGFNTPGREQSFTFGSLMMQIRKYKISVILISQRTAVVAKSALSQCENIIAFKSVDQTGLDYLEAVAGHQARELLPLLQQGEALVFGPAISSNVPVVIKVSQ
jgi:hypothetical protein